MTVHVETNQPRRPNGQFGRHVHTAPETTLGHHRPGSSPVTLTIPHVATERQGFLRRSRTITRELSAVVHVRHFRHDAGVEGDDGERILDGQAYLPVLRHGAPIPADDASLRSLALFVQGGITELDSDADIAQQQLRQYAVKQSRMNVIIGGELWMPASRAPWVHL